MPGVSKVLGYFFLLDVIHVHEIPLDGEGHKGFWLHLTCDTNTYLTISLRLSRSPCCCHLTSDEVWQGVCRQLKTWTSQTKVLPYLSNPQDFPLRKSWAVLQFRFVLKSYLVSLDLDHTRYRSPWLYRISFTLHSKLWVTNEKRLPRFAWVSNE